MSVLFYISETEMEDLNVQRSLSKLALINQMPTVFSHDTLRCHRSKLTVWSQFIHILFPIFFIFYIRF